MNELRLNSGPTGFVRHHLMYADDSVAFVPSAEGLPALLDLCLTFGKDNDILFKRSKSCVNKTLFFFIQSNLVNMQLFW